MKKKEERLEKQLAETQAENRRLHDPLQKVRHWKKISTAHTHLQAREEVTELHRQLANYMKDKQSLEVSHRDIHC